jgi:hypothetical protein
MALELLEHLSTSGAARSILDGLRERLAEDGYDIEGLIDDLDAICAGDRAQQALGVGSQNADLVTAAAEARSETEWFVQAACERLQPDDAEFTWGPLLGCSASTPLTIATTNYDRAIEIAASRLGIPYEDGFAPFDGREWCEWVGINGDSTLQLLKIHGSTDWYRVVDTQAVVKLRHPMPLFGGVTLQLGDESLGSLGSALVLPSREKLKNLPPFPDLSHELFAAGKAATGAIFVGTSLRDPDLRSLCASLASRGVPTAVVGRTAASEPDGGVPVGAYPIRQTSGTFLMSTLPTLLRSGQISSEGLAELSATAEPHQSGAMLGALRLLGSSSPSERSGAIESLWQLRADLPARVIQPLLGTGQGQVAVDALGLIPLSREAGSLAAAATELAETTADAAFREEIQLLNSVVGNG